ncbi:MAG TPA: 2-C-methyl-D-erythritol 4-phosphate cytidylyltransferase [Jatrophihabitans sp.]|nr:2-C-methyl-D-erythritol 4-phosphate cytidylyltransferase [Jatrophihabitans sp.]
MAANGRLTVAAILVAAGSGERLRAGVPKAFVPVGGQSLLARALAIFAGHSAVDHLVVVAPQSHLSEAAELSRAAVVPGGATRQASVAAGLAALPADVGFVLVHDVARPFVPAAVIDAVVAALAAGADAVVPVVPIHDTVRAVDADGRLAGVIDRATLAAMQTPQGFRRDVLVRAHQRAGAVVATDDAALVEALGLEVAAVPGDERAFKVTTPLDLAYAETIAGLLSAPHPPVPGGIS